jgi:ADP-ribose pyrophosphatase
MGSTEGADGMVKHVYTGKIVTLDVVTVTLPNGITAELEMVRHPGAAAVVPVKDDGTVILVKQYRHAAGGFIYEIPAGKLQPGEIPVVCAARELDEEVGLRAESIDPLASILTSPGFADEVIHIFKATGLAPGRQELEHDEVLDVEEMPLQQAIELIQDGTIRDAKTIVGLQAVYLRQVIR